MLSVRVNSKASLAKSDTNNQLLQPPLAEVDRGPATEALVRELHLWRLTRQLRRVFTELGDGPMQRTRERDQAEAKNILDRWLLSFQLGSGDGDARATGLSVFPRNIGLDDFACRKLIDECLEKKFSTSRGNAQHIAEVLVDTVAQFDAKVEHLVRADMRRADDGFVVFLERRRLGGPTSIDGDRRGEDLEEVEGQLRVGCVEDCSIGSNRPGGYASPCCPRVWFLARNYGLATTARMLLRYEALGTGSLQWGDPVTVHHTLYHLMGVRYEGFASPLNSKLLGLPGAAFCSLFPDTDAPFGSLGDFFSIDFSEHPGGWTVNPPFIEELMLRVADKILDYLDGDAGGAAWFFVTFPRWTDCPGWLRLDSSAYRLQLLDLTPQSFTVQDCYGNVLRPRMTLSIFAMGRRLPNDTDWHGAVQRCFTSVDIGRVRTVWMTHCLKHIDTH